MKDVTKQEFDATVDRLRRGGKAAMKTDAESRVFVAAGLVMRNRLSLPDNWPWGGPPMRSWPSFWLA